VPGSVLHVPQRHAGVKRGGHEPVAQAVRADGIGDARPPREAPDDLLRAVTVKPPPGARPEDWPVLAPVEQHVDGSGRARRQRRHLALSALAPEFHGAVAALLREVRDIEPEHLGDPAPVRAEQADERVRPRAVSFGDVEQPPELVTVDPEPLRLARRPRAPDTPNGGAGDQASSSAQE